MPRSQKLIIREKKISRSEMIMTMIVDDAYCHHQFNNDDDRRSDKAGPATFRSLD